MDNLLTLQRLELFPVTTRLEDKSGQKIITIAGCDLTQLADHYGTPLYLYDRATLDQAVANYRLALHRFYPGEANLTYAGKAFLCLAISQWAKRQDLWIDCTGAGELSIVRQAGLSRNSILVHGVNKSLEDMGAALTCAGRIVIDNLPELYWFIKQCNHQQISLPEIWLRLRPGLAVDTHIYTQTGQDDSKFGMSPSEIEEAVGVCQAHSLPLTGLHFHQGSHFHDPTPLGTAIDIALDLLTILNQNYQWLPSYFCPGGGWGVAYHEEDLPHPHISEYVEYIATRLVDGCQARDLPLPFLQLEPGRSLVAQAGVSLYRVGAVKHTAHRRWLLLDGGLADNPRPAMYRARYSALPIVNPQRSITDPAWVAGPYCESGDVLIEALPLPDIAAGELLAIPTSGAYQLSMGSNYNGARKPAVLWLENGVASLIQRRETLDDLFCRDFPLPSQYV